MALIRLILCSSKRLSRESFPGSPAFWAGEVVLALYARLQGRSAQYWFDLPAQVNERAQDFDGSLRHLVQRGPHRYIGPTGDWRLFLETT